MRKVKLGRLRVARGTCRAERGRAELRAVRRRCATNAACEFSALLLRGETVRERKGLLLALPIGAFASMLVGSSRIAPFGGFRAGLSRKTARTLCSMVAKMISSLYLTSLEVYRERWIEVSLTKQNNCNKLPESFEETDALRLEASDRLKGVGLRE